MIVEFISASATPDDTFCVRCVPAVAEPLATAIDEEFGGAVPVVYVLRCSSSWFAYVFGTFNPPVAAAEVSRFAAGYILAWVDASPQLKEFP